MQVLMGHVNEMATLFAEVPPTLPPSLLPLFGNYSLFIPLVPCTFVALCPTRTCCITRNQSNEISSATRARKVPNKAEHLRGGGEEGVAGHRHLWPAPCAACLVWPRLNLSLNCNSAAAWQLLKTNRTCPCPCPLCSLLLPHTHTHTYQIKHTHTNTLFVSFSLLCRCITPYK